MSCGVNCKCKQEKSFDRDMETRVTNIVIAKEIIKKFTNDDKIIFARWIAGHSIVEIFNSGDVSIEPEEIETRIRNMVKSLRDGLEISGVEWCK